MQSALQNLPVGWRFFPTNEELLVHYLKNKRLGNTIHGLDIQDVQICDFDPWDLIDKDSGAEGRHFFCRRQFHLKSGGVQRKRKAKAGFWKRTGDPRSITREDSSEVIGTKKIFVYQHPEPTKYVIHEYELTEGPEFSVQDCNDFVLCKLMITKKKKGSKKAKKVGPLSKKKATVNSNQIEVNFKKKRSLNSKEKEAKKSKKSRKYLLDAASVSISNKQKQPYMVANLACDDGEPNNHATSDFELQNRSNERAHQAFGEREAINHQSPIPVTAVSAWEKGESSHQGAYGSEDQNKYEMINTSNFDRDITSFAMEFDFNQTYEETSFLIKSDLNKNSLEISNLSGYSMSGISSQMMACLGYPNDSTTISFHERSSTLVENQNEIPYEETSFLMKSDLNKNSVEISNLSGYGMSGTSSQMMACLGYPNDSTTISFHERSSTLVKNQNEIPVVSTHNNVETSGLANFEFQNSTQNYTISYPASGNQKDTSLYSAYSNQNEQSYPAVFNSENQNPMKETSVSSSLEGRWSLPEENPLTFESEKETDRPDSEYSLETDLEAKFEEFESGHKKTKVSNLEDLGEFAFPDITSQMLDELICFDDLADTLSSEPEPIHPQEPRSALWRC